MNKFSILVLTALVSSGVWASECELSNKKPSDIALCYEEKSFAQVVSKLNKLKELSKEQLSYNPQAITELNISQNAWLKYRDSYCITYSNYHTEMSNHSNCIISLNNQRAEQLQLDIDAN